MWSLCSRLPEQETERYIPTEIIEQILLNLPIKSLVRFSCVSTSWNSTITSPQFIAKRKRDCGRSMVIINPNPFHFDLRNAFCRPLSTVSDNPAGNATSSMLVSPFRGHVSLEAFCDQLWCVLVKKSIYLLNPFTGACKKLPHAPLLKYGAANHDVAYGLGYDAVDDDYKVLQIRRPAGQYILGKKSFICSLKNDSWREIPSHFSPGFPNCSNGLFVDGCLNWMVMADADYSELVTFDFSTETFGVLEQPIYLPALDLRSDDVDLAVLRTKLCVFVNYMPSYEDSALVVWAMQDYGAVESWTKLYEIRYESLHPITGGVLLLLRPLYVYEDGRVVVLASCGYTEWDIIVYRDLDVVAHSKLVSPLRAKELKGRPDRRLRGGFVYAETFASPLN